MSFYKHLLYIFFLFFFQFSYSQNDCIDALIACGSNSYNNLSIFGSGVEDEVSSNNTCGANEENNTLWIKINIRTSGNLGFKLIPENTDMNVDFDFFVFGPTASCANLGTAIRCSTTNPIAAHTGSNTTGMNSLENDVTEGPGANGNNFVKWLDVLVGETYYIVFDRYVGNSNFSIEWSGTATFNDTPAFNNLATGATLNLEKCDSDNVDDDKTLFDLTPNIALAVGPQNNIITTFHTSENDAIIGQNPISNSNSYENISNPQIVYLRLENSLTGCFSTTEFTLKIAPYEAPEAVNIEKCDLDNNGFETFNLSNNNAILTNGNPNVSVTYHPTANDTTVLPNMYTNQVAFTDETIWAKVKDAAGCYEYKSFKIIINTIPTVNPAQLTQCDFDIFPDGLTHFNLNESIADLTNNDSNLSVKFYLNLNNAQNNVGELSNNYSNISNPQILTAKIINNTTGCYSFTQLTLNVNTNPTITKIIEKCDDSIEDGITTFDLAAAGFETPGNSVSYYYSSNDALLEQNLIITTEFSTQTVYARIENGNDCSGINIINLQVNTLPAFTIENKDILCLNMPTKPVTVSTIITNPTAYTYFWTPNGETTSSINAFNPGNYSVKVTNTATGCFKTLSTEVRTSDIAIIHLPTIINFENYNTITINTSGIGDYEYSLDSQFGPYQDSNVFTNISGGIHFVYVRDKNGCGISDEQLNVFAAPKFFTPNADGFNDYWNIKGLSEDSNPTIYIFDRTGKLIKQLTPFSKGWDGKFNGRNLPSDDYWFSVTFIDGNIVKGHFTLKR